MIRHYLITALRNLWKNRTQNIIAIIGLAFGLYCFALTTYTARVVTDVNSDTPHSRRIVAIAKEMKWCDTVPPSLNRALDKESLRKIDSLHIPGITTVCHISYPYINDFMIMGKGGKEEACKINNTQIDDAFFTIFEPKVIEGSRADAVRSPNSVVLTRSTANRLFGKGRTAMGKHLHRNEDTWTGGTQGSEHVESSRVLYTVRAVVEDIPVGSSYSFYNPVEMFMLNDETLPNDAGYQLYALLAPGRDMEEVSRTLHTRSNHLEPDDVMYLSASSQVPNKFLGYKLQKADPQGCYFEELKKSFIPITLSIGLLVLLICLLNYFSLLTGSWLNRTPEFSLRKILGSTTRGNFLMLVMQALLLLVIAALLSMLARELFMPHDLYIKFNDRLYLTAGRFLHYLGQYIGLIALISLAVCGAISLYIRHSQAQRQLSGRGGGKMVRNLLMGLQFLICWIFVILSINIQIESSHEQSQLFSSLINSDKERIFYIDWKDYSVNDATQRALLDEKIKNLEGIEDVSLINDLYFNARAYDGFTLTPDSIDRMSQFLTVDEHFAQVMNLHLIRGRMARNSSETVINKVMSDSMRLPVNSVIYFSQNPVNITGIFDGALNTSQDQSRISQDDAICLKYISPSPGALLVKARKGEEGKVRRVLNNLLAAELSEAQMYSNETGVKSISQCIDNTLSFELRYRGLILLVSCVCLFITLIGVYAAISIDTERRRKEMAIRKINGARPVQIALLIVRRYLWILVLTFAVAIPLIHYILKLWEKEAPAWPVWAVTFAAITLLTLVTLAIKVWNIVRENPSEVIKGQ